MPSRLPTFYERICTAEIRTIKINLFFSEFTIAWYVISWLYRQWYSGSEPVFRRSKGNDGWSDFLLGLLPYTTVRFLYLIVRVKTHRMVLVPSRSQSCTMVAQALFDRFADDTIRHVCIMWLEIDGCDWLKPAPSGILWNYGKIRTRSATACKHRIYTTSAKHRRIL